ncbi:CgeB family protein [Halobellus inordinatus]|uniref:CgeB family protein n=1 Tax=Halobellus inordinatus TaxID=1126236 RepID=UPI002114354D|nr:glycosyltransferase [Halobellus ramosii]
MEIGILTFGFRDLADWQDELYREYGFDPENPAQGTTRYADWNNISGDSEEAFSLAREFRELGHDAFVAHYESVVEASSDADLILSLGIGGVIDEYQAFGDTDAIYWWWVLGGYQDDPGDLDFAEKYLYDSQFDGVITNSRQMVPELQKHLPAKHLHIGCDTEKVTPGTGTDAYDCDITYLGLGNYKRQEQYDMLFEPATEYDFRIYGADWEDSKYAAYHHGILPRGDISALYNSATVVLGLHHDYIKFGMVNGRVFRALGTNSIYIDQYHPKLDSEMGEYLTLVESKAEMADVLEDIFSNPEPYQEKAAAGGEYVREHHSYKEKCKGIIQFHTEKIA